MPNEYRVWGPPGVGKTSWIRSQVERLVKEHGSDSVLLVSFTRAAAEELASRDMAVDQSRIGTLHAVAFRALGSPPIAETKIDEWNSVAPPQFQLKGENKDALDNPAFEFRKNGSTGDAIFQNINLNRVKMIDQRLWPQQDISFYKKWCEWKDENGYISFTDMLSLALEKLPVAPGNPKYIVVDESQDLDRLSLTLLRSWASHADNLYVVGDPNQAIYGFKGSTPHDFLEPAIPLSHQKVLKQSYRVPRGVHEYSQKWISQLQVGGPKEYYPRDYDGSVTHKRSITYKNPVGLLPLIDESLQANKTVMILTTCSYMLVSILKLLRSYGYPFQNQYRPTRKDWNAWSPESKGTTTFMRFLSFLRPWNPEELWSASDLKAWLPMMNARSVLQHGAKKFVKSFTQEKAVTRTSLGLILKEECLDVALSGNTKWLTDNCLSKYRSSLDYLVAGYKRFGIDALSYSPKLTIGTAHSVKGGEADRVIFFPDLSLAGMCEWVKRGETHEEIIRLFYVAMTRAREDVVICGPSSNLYVKLPNGA